MKRILSLFTAVLFAALILVPSAHAAQGNAVFSMNRVENVSPGESFTVTLSISGTYEVHGMNLSIEFDPNSMTLESCEEGEFLNRLRQQSSVPVLDAKTLVNEGKIKLGVICPIDAATGSGDLLVMKFHVNEGVTVNQQVIMVIHDLIYMPIEERTGTPVPFTTENSIITLKQGSAPDNGYNDGDSGVGNNIGSSPSQAPGSTPNPGAAATPGTAPAPGTTPTPGTTPSANVTDVPDNAASDTADPADTSKPGSETTKTDATADPNEAAGSEKPVDPENNAANNVENNDDGKTASNKKSPIGYIIGAAAVAVIGAGAAIFLKKKK